MKATSHFRRVTAMTTKERILATIEGVGDENLDELYRLIRSFVASRTAQPKAGIMAKLKGVKIEAPPDFTAKLDQDPR
jgi:hypothetical protein